MDGIRFQSEAGGAANDVWFHIRMKEEEADCNRRPSEIWV